MRTSDEREVEIIREWLRGRLSAVLAWYNGCDAVPETLANVKRDLDDVFREMRVKFGLSEVPFTPVASFDSEGYINVRLVSKKAN